MHFLVTCHFMAAAVFAHVPPDTGHCSTSLCPRFWVTVIRYSLHYQGHICLSLLHNMSTPQDNLKPTSVARFSGLWSLCSSVSIVTRLQAGQLRLHFCQGQRLFSSPLPPSGPIHPPSSPLPPSAEVKNLWSYTSAVLYIFIAWWIKFGFGTHWSS